MNKNLKDLIVNYTTKLKDENAILKEKLKDYDRMKEELDDITEFIKTHFSIDDSMKLGLKETKDVVNFPIIFKEQYNVSFGQSLESKMKEQTYFNIPDKLEPSLLSSSVPPKRLHKSTKYFDKRRLKKSMMLFKKNNPPPSEVTSDIEINLEKKLKPINFSPLSINVNEDKSNLDTIKNLFINDIIPIKKK